MTITKKSLTTQLIDSMKADQDYRAFVKSQQIAPLTKGLLQNAPIVDLAPYRESLVQHVIRYKETVTTIPKKKQGKKWIKENKRCAIYARDKGRCAYCGSLYKAPNLDQVDPMNPDTYQNVFSIIDRQVAHGNCDGSFVLTLDHILPRIACKSLETVGLISKGYTNSDQNLVTACKSCNDRRNDQSVAQYLSTLGTFDHRTTWTAEKALSRIVDVVNGKTQLQAFKVQDFKRKMNRHDSEKKRMALAGIVQDKNRLPSWSQNQGIGLASVRLKVDMWDMVKDDKR